MQESYGSLLWTVVQSPILSQLLMSVLSPAWLVTTAFNLILLFVLFVQAETRTEFTIHVDKLTGAVEVPAGFFGLSLEPLSQGAYYARDGVFLQALLNLLAYDTGPIHLRWGGNLQDIDAEVLPDDVWEALLWVYTNTGQNIKHSLGLNLPARNTTLAALQLQNAKRFLPETAVATIIIGNEPDSYMYKRRGYPKTYMTSVSSGYFDEQLSYMRVLAPITADWIGTRVFQGPGVANSADFPTSVIKHWINLGQKEKEGPYTQVLSLHFYAGNSHNADASVSSIFSAEKSRYIRNVVERYAAPMVKAGLQFRLDETNSLSNSGKPGVSDRLAAALWVIDHSLNIMQVKAHGINFHTSGCSPYSLVFFPGFCGTPTQTEDKYRQMCPDSCGQAGAPGIVNSPYYGAWFLQEALRGSATGDLTLLGHHSVRRRGDPHIRVYALTSTDGVRVVVLNENDVEDDTDIILPGQGWGAGTVKRLMADGDDGLSSRMQDISWGGQKVDPKNGRITGKEVVHHVEPEPVAGGAAYILSLPPASALLLTVPQTQH